MGHHEKAILDANRLIQLDPHNVDALDWRSLFCLNKGIMLKQLWILHARQHSDLAIVGLCFFMRIVFLFLDLRVMLK
jgi:hypothetical protein